MDLLDLLGLRRRRDRRATGWCINPFLFYQDLHLTQFRPAVHLSAKSGQLTATYYRDISEKGITTH